MIAPTAKATSFSHPVTCTPDKSVTESRTAQAYLGGVLVIALKGILNPANLRVAEP
jgi:hypothetical protein